MSTILTGVVPLWDLQYLNIIAKNSKGVQIPNNRAAVAEGSIFVSDNCEVHSIFYLWTDSLFVIEDCSLYLLAAKVLFFISSTTSSINHPFFFRRSIHGQITLKVYHIVTLKSSNPCSVQI